MSLKVKKCLVLVIIVIHVIDSRDLISLLREKVLGLDLSEFDKSDLEIVKTDDEWVKLFLDRRDGNVNEAMDMLRKALKWRKEIGLKAINESSFPLELYQSGIVAEYGKDVNGIQVLILRGSGVKKWKQWTDVYCKYLAYLFEKNRKRGLTILGDARGLNKENLNIDIVRGIEILDTEHFPGVIKLALAYEIPSNMYYFFKSWKWFRYNVKVVREGELGNFINRDQLPTFLNGTNQMPYGFSKEGAPKANQLGQRLKFDGIETEKFVKSLEPYIKGQL